MNAQSNAPVLFVSHGAPTFALEPGRLGASLRELGTRLGAVTAVMVVSPHWQTRDVAVMTSPLPETVHDFGGFSRALYDLKYPAPGAPGMAQAAAGWLSDAGFSVREEAGRGFDHGAWVPLMHLFPEARIPVFQVSLPHPLHAGRALEMGAALAALRTQGVVLMGSGSMTHNLHDLRPAGAGGVAYATEFTHWVRDAVAARDVQALRNYRRLAPHAERAHPTEEHFLPLLVAMGATGEQDELEVFDGEITYGVLSMESYVWGMSAWDVA